MATVTMGIDQSLTCTGVTVLKTDSEGNVEILLTEAISTSKTNLPPMADTIHRAKEIASKLDAIQVKYRPDYVAIESLSFGSAGNATRNLAILFGIICVAMGIDNPNLVPPTTLKKFATGNGRASKKDMLAAIEASNLGLFLILNNTTIKAGKYDIADAYWIARWMEKNK